MRQFCLIAVRQSGLRAFSTENTSDGGEKSEDQEEQKQSFKTTGQLRQALIKASFVNARTIGFNDQCIVEACKDFGLTPVSAGIVKRGPIEVVDYAMEFWLKQMHQELKSHEEMQKLRIRERVHLGVKTRLEL